MNKGFTIIAGLLVMLALVMPAGAVSLVKSSLSIDDAPFIQAPPYLGQKIKLQVTVGVQYESIVPLNGFWLKVWFKKPNGATTTAEWFDYRNEYIGKGSQKTYYISTSTVADVEGTWTAYVVLYTSDKATKINSASKTFTVTQAIPAGWVNINQVIGYGVAAALVALAAWSVRRV